MRVAAICTNMSELDHGGWRLPGVCAKYPGAGFLPHLDQLAAQAGIRVMSGSEAIRALKAGHISAADIQVIQESANQQADVLLHRGARASLLYCMESPLYDPFFYDAVAEQAPRFRRSMLFSGGTDRMYFPSFDLDHMPEPVAWEDRDPIPFVCVMTNKHYTLNGHVASQSHAHAVRAQLQDMRYDVISYLAEREALALYGKNWPEPIKEIPAGEKVAVTRRYRFALCFENVRQPGYVTEKIIDAIVAGCVPVYLGAPDVAEHVPASAFIDAGRFSTPKELMDAVLMLSRDECRHIVRVGREFLNSAQGGRHAYQCFALKVLLILQAAGA